MPPPMVVDMTVDSTNCMSSDTVQGLIETAMQRPTPTYSRPSRASKARALDKIRDIHDWENCSENSKRFKEAERIINEEFDRLHPDERTEVDDDNDYSESEHDSEPDNLSFVDSDSEAADDEASWSAAESDPAESSSDSEDMSTDDIESPTLPTSNFTFPEAVTPTQIDSDGRSCKRRKYLLDSDDDT